MRAHAIARYLRISPSKLKRSMDLVRGKPLAQALSQLEFSPTKGARLLRKVLLSAAANAENNHAMNREELWVAEGFVGQGPMFKRLSPGPRGMASLIRKRMSHVTFVLADEEERPARAG